MVFRMHFSLMCAFGMTVSQCICVFVGAIYVFASIVGGCDSFIGHANSAGFAIGDMINNGNVCYVTKSNATSAGGLLLGMFFVYLLSSIAIWTKRPALFTANVAVLLPIQLAFAAFLLFVVVVSTNSPWVVSGSVPVALCGGIFGLLNLSTVAIVYCSVLQCRKDVVVLDEDSQEDERATARRFELQVQRFSQIAQAMGRARGRGGGGGGGGGGRGGGGGGNAPQVAQGAGGRGAGAGAGGRGAGGRGGRGRGAGAAGGPGASASVVAIAAVPDVPDRDAAPAAWALPTISGLSVAAWIFFVAGTASPWFTGGMSIVRMSWGYFQFCMRVGDESECASLPTAELAACPSLLSTVQAGRAFHVMVCLFAGLSIAYGIARIVKPDLVASLPDVVRTAYFALRCAIVVFGVVAWSIGFALYTAPFCGSSAQSSTSMAARLSMGPSAPLVLLGWILWVAAFYWEWAVEAAMAAQQSDAGGGGSGSDVVAQAENATRVVRPSAAVADVDMAEHATSIEDRSNAATTPYTAMS